LRQLAAFVFRREASRPSVGRRKYELELKADKLVFGQHGVGIEKERIEETIRSLGTHQLSTNQSTS
jgi:hypothetical protein